MTASSTGTAAIGATALRYKGRVPYSYGGASPRGWDCSGMVNYVLGHDLGLTLPGGIKGFKGTLHGPVVLQYLAWSGAVRVRVPISGDLCVWAGPGPLGHIGIALGPTEMISALNPAYGTAVTPIQGTGPASAPLSFHRVAGIPGAVLTGDTSLASAASLPSGCAASLIMLPALPVLALAAHWRGRNNGKGPSGDHRNGDRV